MRSRLLLLASYLLLLAASPSASASNIKIELTKSDAEEWFVTYESITPVKRLAFVRNPNKSRIKRWSSLSTDFTLAYEEGSEVIRRIDGAPFTSVSFRLTPTYIPLAKEYAPFSPFSDGGMLLHSARFFVCSEVCTQGSYIWEMKVVVPAGEHIIVRGNIAEGSAKWIDSRNGQKVYVGAGTPVKDSHFVSIIDKKLPEKLHKSIKTELPQLMTFFSDKFGRLGYRPTLFASYSKTKNGRYGNQGGTLPGQIFMHWYGNKSIQPLNIKATYWFFAHEVAHLYQGEASLITDPQQAWLHEGAAELFAGIASDPAYLRTRQQKAKQECATGLKKSTSFTESVARRPVLHYSCGLLLMSAINEDLKVHGDMTIFELWALFNRAVNSGSAANAHTFIHTAKPFISSELGHYLSDFVAKDALDLNTLSALSPNHEI